MALTILGTGLTSAHKGITSDEVGINCAKFTLELTPEVNDWLPGITGEARGKAVSPIPMGKLNIDGEILGATGVMAAVFGTAFVPANGVTFFGRSAGGFYLNSATVSQEREGWYNVSTEFESRPGLA